MATALGADSVPNTSAEAAALIAQYRPHLQSTMVTREVARLVLKQPAPTISAAPAQALVMQAAMDLLPEWAMAMHGFHFSPVKAAGVRAGTWSIARTLRWAFADARKRIEP